MRKTKKEKLEAEARREKFLYSLSEIQKVPQKKEIREAPKQGEKSMQPVSQPQVSTEDFSYLGKDLRRTAILALAAFIVQIVLYLTIF